MATGMLVTISWREDSADFAGAVSSRPALTSQFMTFVGKRSAEKALEAIRLAHAERAVDIVGAIFEEVVI